MNTEQKALVRYCAIQKLLEEAEFYSDKLHGINDAIAKVLKADDDTIKEYKSRLKELDEANRDPAPPPEAAEKA